MHRQRRRCLPPFAPRLHPRAREAPAWSDCNSCCPCGCCSDGLCAWLGQGAVRPPGRLLLQTKGLPLTLACPRTLPDSLLLATAGLPLDCRASRRSGRPSCTWTTPCSWRRAASGAGLPLSSCTSASPPSGSTPSVSSSTGVTAWQTLWMPRCLRNTCSSSSMNSACRPRGSTRRRRSRPTTTATATRWPSSSSSPAAGTPPMPSSSPTLRPARWSTRTTPPSATALTSWSRTPAT